MHTGPNLTCQAAVQLQSVQLFVESADTLLQYKMQDKCVLYLYFIVEPGVLLYLDSELICVILKVWFFTAGH